MMRILQVVSIMDAGGMENFLMNLYRRMDRRDIQFDFLVHHAREGLFDSEILDLGGRIHHLPVLDDFRLPRYRKQLRFFFAAHPEYRIVHGHLSSLAMFYLGAARAQGVPWRIAHSHGDSFVRSPKGCAKYLLFRGAARNANARFACSEKAGQYLFGGRPFQVWRNAVEPERFAYDPAARAEARRALGLRPDDRLIGHVGRFNPQKNHAFLVEAFRRVYRQEPAARLLLVGGGELTEKVRAQVARAGLAQAVLFAGVRRDVEQLYQAMDAFVLPSRFEGLPLTGVEAQYAGLPCLFSDVVTREVRISPEAAFLPVGAGSEDLWAQQMLSCCRDARQARHAARVDSDAFDSAGVARALYDCYARMEEQAL